MIENEMAKLENAAHPAPQLLRVAHAPQQGHVLRDVRIPETSAIALPDHASCIAWRAGGQQGEIAAPLGPPVGAAARAPALRGGRGRAA